MITFLSEEQVRKIKVYSSSEYIPEDIFITYTPKSYLEAYGYTKESINYIIKIINYSDYISKLVHIYKTILEVQLELKKQEIQDERKLLENRKRFGTVRELYIRNFEDEQIKDFNYKEKRARNRIKAGKKIFIELKKIYNNSIINPKLQQFIKNTIDKRNKLSEKTFIKQDYYEKVLTKEDDIYYDYISDSKTIIESEFYKYLIAESYFKNQGESLFVLTLEHYISIIGEHCGKIREAETIDYTIEEKLQKYEQIISDFSDLEKDLKNTTKVRNSDNSIVNQSENEQDILKKDEYFCDDIQYLYFKQLCENVGFKNFCSILPETEVYFKIFIKLGYMIMNNGSITFMSPLSGKVFVEFLKDPDFKFNSVLTYIPKEAFINLFGKELNKLEQRCYVSKIYPKLKEILKKNKAPLAK